MRKKGIKFVILSCLCLTLVFNFFIINKVALAEDSYSVKYKTIFNANEITDLDKLYNIARSNSFSKNTLINPAKIIETNAANKTKQIVPTYTATQLLKIEKTEDGMVRKSFATTYFADVKSSYLEDQYREQWDGSLSVRAYSTVYYSIISNQGINYYKLSKVTGGWYKADNTVSLSNRQVTISNQGFILGGGISNTILYKYPTSNSFSYLCPSSWPPVAAYTNYFPGCITSVTLTRGGGSWVLQLPNNLPPTL